jgi:uncharacterized protein (TIGR00255 family)
MTQPVASMTGFARAEGAVRRLAWAWELRGVNGRGLDLKIRLPPGAEALEPALREAAGRVVKRGNVTANLSVQREAQSRLAVDEAALEQALSLAVALAARIGAEPPRAEALLALPGVMRQGASEPDEDATPAYRQGFEAALADFVQARRSEGARLATSLATLLDEVAALCREAQAQAADQPQAQRARMLETVRGLLAEAPGLPEERIAQEVALLASRSDVREELDRLDSHLQAARALLDEGGPVGRRLDFLVQEFNREANTLCAKSASVALTATGLRLKAAIEQMREQVQNIE